jgi:hypothetical protein
VAAQGQGQGLRSALAPQAARPVPPRHANASGLHRSDQAEIEIINLDYEDYH